MKNIWKGPTGFFYELIIEKEDVREWEQFRFAIIYFQKTVKSKYFHFNLKNYIFNYI